MRSPTFITHYFAGSFTDCSMEKQIDLVFLLFNVKQKASSQILSRVERSANSRYRAMLQLNYIPACLPFWQTDVVPDALHLDRPITCEHTNTSYIYNRIGKKKNFIQECTKKYDTHSHYDILILVLPLVEAWHWESTKNTSRTHMLEFPVIYYSVIYIYSWSSIFLPLSSLTSVC